MYRLIWLPILLLALTVTACSTDHEAPGREPGAAPNSIDTGLSKSSIVTNMENYYQENEKILIDPCHDSFIYAMESIGYTLDADIVLPKGEQRFGYWFATCMFKSRQLNALAESSTAPFMRADQSLVPSNEMFQQSYYVDINDRRSIARPYADEDPNCMLSMATSFGSVTITGRLFNERNASRACTQVEQLARQIEPWIND